MKNKVVLLTAKYTDIVQKSRTLGGVRVPRSAVQNIITFDGWGVAAFKDCECIIKIYDSHGALVSAVPVRFFYVDFQDLEYGWVLFYWDFPY